MSFGGGVDPCCVRAGFAVDVGYGEGPEGDEIDAGDEFAGEGGQELPMPAEEPGEDAGHAKVEDIVRRESRAFDEQGEDNELDDVGQDGEQQRGLHARAGRDAEVAGAGFGGMDRCGHKESIRQFNGGGKRARAGQARSLFGVITS